MDTTDTNIRFDENGVCNHCTNYFKVAREVRKTGLWEFTDFLRELRDRKTGRYDAILGISGGADSSFVAYLAKSFELEVFLVHLDDGWNTRVATENVSIIEKATGFDLVTIHINTREYNDLLLSYLKASVVGLENPTDQAIRAVIYQTAGKLGIKNILNASNWATEGINASAWGYRNDDTRNLRAIHKRFGTVELHDYPIMGLLSIAYRHKFKGVKQYKMLDVIDYYLAWAKGVLREEWGWIDYGGKHQENRFTKFVEGYIGPRKFGFDKRKAWLSALVCAGQITRKQGLEKLERPVYSKVDEVREKLYFCHQLGITEEEFEELMVHPIRSHYDFPTNKWSVRLLRVARKILGGG